MREPVKRKQTDLEDFADRFVYHLERRYAELLSVPVLDKEALATCRDMITRFQDAKTSNDVRSTSAVH